MGGVTEHGTPFELSSGQWVEIFLRSVGEDQIRREGYLVGIAANGNVACKACGCYYDQRDCSASGHFAFHLRQLDHYLLETQEGKRDETAEGFYPIPCTSCGNPIPRSGRAGRPPTECDTCRYPLASGKLAENAAPESVEEVLDAEVWG